MLLELNQKQKGLTFLCTAACAAFVSYALERKLIPQTIISALAVYLLTGDRPSIVYATIVSLPRDIRWVIQIYDYIILFSHILLKVLEHNVFTR